MWAAPAGGTTVLWQAPNTAVDLDLYHSDVEFENPLNGTEMAGPYKIIEWRDADYLPASPRVPAPDPTLKPEGGHFQATVFSPDDVEDSMPKWKQVFDRYFR